MLLDATDARRLTDNARTENTIRPYLTHIDEKIRKAIADGRWQITDPLSGLHSSDLRPPHPDVKDAVQRAVEAKGYVWESHVGGGWGPGGTQPPAGAGEPYDTISWADH